MRIHFQSTTADASAPDAHPSSLSTESTCDEIAENIINDAVEDGDTKNDHAVQAINDLRNNANGESEGEEFSDDREDEEDKSSKEDDGAASAPFSQPSNLKEVKFADALLKLGAKEGGHYESSYT